MSRRFVPLDPEQVLDALVIEVGEGPCRVAVDGADAAAPVRWADRLAACLRVLGRPATVLRADHFRRDASVRLEYGHEDVQSYLDVWLDEVTLAREVLAPLGPGGTRRFLPSLRDPVTNRSTREAARDAASNEVVMVAGELLLGRGLAFDRTIHLALSPPALRRQTTRAWTVEALEGYDERVRPREVADVVVRVDDPRRPAISLRPATR